MQISLKDKKNYGEARPGTLARGRGPTASGGGQGRQLEGGVGIGWPARAWSQAGGAGGGGVGGGGTTRRRRPWASAQGATGVQRRWRKGGLRGDSMQWCSAAAAKAALGRK
jgi:hypothetical protein